MAAYSKDKLLALLQELKLDFAKYDHPVVMTVEAQAKYVGHLEGALTKNLFLKDKKHRYYVISALSGTTIDLKVLSQRLGLGKGGLRMAPEEAFPEILKVPLGSVTPFALINETAKSVSLILDQGLKAQKLCFFHPLSNDATIAIEARGLDKFLVSLGRTPSYVDLEANPPIGKDQPPDLAALVLSEAPMLDAQSVKAALSSPAAEKSVAVKKSNGSSEAAPKPSHTEKTSEKPSNTSIPGSLTSVTDVNNLVNEIIEKTATAVLLEVSKDSLEQQKVILDRIKKRVCPDLENLTMMFKNAVYTEGFHSGRQSVFDKYLKTASLQR